MRGSEQRKVSGSEQSGQREQVAEQECSNFTLRQCHTISVLHTVTLFDSVLHTVTH